MPVPYDRNGNGKNCKGAGYRLVWQGTHRGSVHFCQKYKTGDNHWHWRSFSLEIPDNVKTITVSFVGMTTREVAITPGEMTIELTAESQALDEVVVVAYGTQKSLRLPVPSPRSEMRNSWNVLWHPSLQPLKAPHRVLRSQATTARLEVTPQCLSEVSAQ